MFKEIHSISNTVNFIKDSHEAMPKNAHFTTSQVEEVKPVILYYRSQKNFMNY